jgi:alanyl aminopeptidase
MTRRPLLALLPLALAAACARAPVRPSPAAAPAPAPVDRAEAPPLLQLPPDVTPLAYRLALDVDPARDRFSGAVEIRVRLDRPRAVLWLHGRGLAISEATVAAAGAPPVPARWSEASPEGLARLELGTPAGPGEVTLRLAWDAPFGATTGLFRVQDGGAWYAATQLEPVDARAVFPGFDEPRFKTPFEVTLRVPEGAVAVGNAPEAEVAAAGPGARRVRFAATRPLPTYLLFVAVGPFEVVRADAPPNAVRPWPLPVRGLAARGQGAGLAALLEDANASLADLERWFGIPFPYEKLDHLVVDAGDGIAMENAGAIRYGGFALPGEGASDARRLQISLTVAHELAHQWFGDLVTLPWWTDTWLNEGFASWVSARVLSTRYPAASLEYEGGGETGAADWTLELDGLASARAIRHPLAHMSQVEDPFDLMSYVKAARVLGMFERLVGAAPFQGAIRGYLRDRAHGTGSGPAVVLALSRAAGRDLAPALASFLDQPGVPLVSARLACDAGGARVLLAQARWRPRGSGASAAGQWQVPVCVRYGAGSASDERCTLLEGTTGELALPGPCPGWIFPNAGGIGWYQVALAPEDLARLRDAGTPLTPAERRALFQGTWAAQRAGALPFAAATALLLEPLSGSDPAVARSAVEVLERARETAPDEGARAAVDASARARLRPLAARLGWRPAAGEPYEAQQLRVAVLGALVRVFGDPDVRREAARRGVRLAGLDGRPPDPDAVGHDLRGIALEAAVAEGGAPAFEALRAAAGRARDGNERRRLLAALAGSGAPALSPRVAGLVLDGQLSPVDRFTALAAWAGARETRALALDFAEARADPLLASFPGAWSAQLPSLFEAGCDAAWAGRLRALFAPRVPGAPGLERPLAQALEGIGICAAVREADGEALRAFFGAPAASAAEPPGGAVGRAR